MSAETTIGVIAGGVFTGFLAVWKVLGFGKELKEVKEENISANNEIKLSLDKKQSKESCKLKHVNEDTKSQNLENSFDDLRKEVRDGFKRTHERLDLITQIKGE